MAVVKLKLIVATGDEGHYEEALSVCAADPDFHFENAADIVGQTGYHIIKGEANPYTAIISMLDGLCKSFGIQIHWEPSSKPAEPIGDEELIDIARHLDELQKNYAEMTQRKQALISSIKESEQIVSQLEHLKDSNITIDRLVNFEYFRFRFGRLPRESYESIQMYSADLKDVFFFPSSIDRQEVWGMYFAVRSQASRVDALFNSLGFERTYISDKAHRRPIEEINSFLADIDRYKEELSNLELEMTEFRATHEATLRTYAEQILSLNRMFELRKHTTLAKGNFCIAGWIPASRTNSLAKSLDQIETVSCTIEKPAAFDRQAPPTIIKNNPVFRPFEDFVKMYGLPSYNEMDPTPFVAITYFIFFGLMFGDVGQGLVLTLAGALIWFAKRANLGKIIAMIGVSSTIFGFFYGSVFGFEDIIHGFNPMENINTTLFAAVGIGAVMIITVMILNICNGIRQRNNKKFLLSPNGLAGLFLYLAFVIVAIGIFDIAALFIPAWLLVAIIVLMLSLLFFSAPLSALLQLKKDWMPKNKLEFLLESFFELFEVILSFITNTISFIRIGAFALSHVGMMTVVFLLAQSANGGHSPLILILGNLFVIGFEGLIVGIQVLRLEFYELFGRFFDGDGYMIDYPRKLVLGATDSQ
ncbi:MAG: hypothetical protein GX303_01665 [Clostridiales bacterium]|nr:hypothetical protein [Clostridiales bacterium]